MADLCEVGKGTCWFGIKEFRGKTQAKNLTDQLKTFRDAYCNPCLESKKLTVLQDINNELTRIRESKVRPMKQLTPADTIKPMLYTPEDEQVSTAPHQEPMMGCTDPSIWLCPRCFTVITNMEYEHLNKDGHCKECRNILNQYKVVE